MSDNTMSTAASSPALSAQTQAAGPRHDFASDKELMLAAIARMEAAVSGERASHERLRSDLAGMAQAIAHVKTSIRNAQTSGKPVNVLVLLTWLEARVNGVRGYLDAAAEPAAPEAVAETAAVDTVQPENVEAAASVHEAVPTVSDVVSRLGRTSDVLEKEVHALEQSAPAADDVPTVSMLGAMVEALTAPETVAAEAKAETETAPRTEEPTVSEQAQAEPEATVFEVAPEAVAAEAVAPETNVAEAALPETVADDSAPEVAAFAEELGAAEPLAVEAEAATANEAETVQIEPLTVEAIIANEPAMDVAVTEIIVEADPSTEAALLVAEPAEAETTGAAETTLPESEAVAQEAIAEETPATALTEMAAAETVAVAETSDAVEVAHEPSAHEFELLTRFAAMEAIPFMRDEVGTAVIFEQKTEFDPAAEQMAFETPAKPVETAAETVQTAAQMEAVSPAEPEIEVAEHVTAETEPAAYVETYAEPMLHTQPEMAVSAEAPLMAVAPGPHPTYAGVSSLSVPLGATAMLHDATKPETASAGVLETAAPVEAVEPGTDAAGIPKIEFFDVDEPKAEAEAATTASGVIAESALDIIVAEPTPVELSEPVVTESAEATAPETAAIAAPEPEAPTPEASSVAIETASAAETISAVETVESETKAESAEVVTAHGETAATPIAETTVEIATASAEAEVTIAGPSETERAAFAAALAEMERAMAAALEPETVSVAATEAQAEATAPVEAEAIVTDIKSSETPEAADDDLSDLFEPEPDAALDPNNILLGPSPVSAPAPAFTLDPATAAVLPMHDMALPEAPKAAAPQTQPAEVVKLEVVKTPAPARSHDPLAPLKAMSDEEKIALFS